MVKRKAFCLILHFAGQISLLVAPRDDGVCGERPSDNQAPAKLTNSRRLT